MTWGISVKAVIIWADGVLLLHNERGEWELPGGQPDREDRSPAAVLRRELAEEVGLEIEVGPLVTTYRYDPVPGRPVLVVVYRCEATRPPTLHPSEEHDDIRVCPLDQLDTIVLPDGYRRAIQQALP